MKNPQDIIYNQILDNLDKTCMPPFNPFENMARQIAEERAERLDTLVMLAFPEWSRKLRSKFLLKHIGKFYKIEVRHISHNKVEVWKGGDKFGEIIYSQDDLTDTTFTEKQSTVITEEDVRKAVKMLEEYSRRPTIEQIRTCEKVEDIFGKAIIRDFSLLGGIRVIEDKSIPNGVFRLVMSDGTIKDIEV